MHPRLRLPLGLLVLERRGDLRRWQGLANRRSWVSILLHLGRVARPRTELHLRHTRARLHLGLRIGVPRSSLRALLPSIVARAFGALCIVVQRIHLPLRRRRVHERRAVPTVGDERCIEVRRDERQVRRRASPRRTERIRRKLRAHAVRRRGERRASRRGEDVRALPPRFFRWIVRSASVLHGVRLRRRLPRRIGLRLRRRRVGCGCGRQRGVEVLRGDDGSNDDRGAHLLVEVSVTNAMG